ncbi:MBL fold metallo-hydrolase [Paenibacillus tarimensis]
MRIQMLGTGNAFAKKNYNNNALIYVDGFTLMVDCGITALISMHELGKPLTDVDAILLTHIHGDHVGGLEEFAFRMKFQYGKKPLMYVPEAILQPLWENTLKGGLMQEGGQMIEDYFNVIPVREQTPVELSRHLTVELLRTPHIPNKPSYSLYFNNRFFYSADMRFNPELLKQLINERGCETIFHDCQLAQPGAVHATLDELLSLPEAIQERIWLMHYDDDQEQYIGRTGLMRFVEQHKIYTI